VTDERTIKDFGAQWTRYADNEGYYASLDLLTDICGPLLDLGRIRGARVADVGSGSGRIVNMLLDAGVSHVTSMEPSDAIEVLKRNTAKRADSITYVHGPGETLPLDRYDAVFSIGVLHHIVDPIPVLNRAYQALRPGGYVLLWVYGQEGNEAYLLWSSLLRRLTTGLPDFILVGLARVLSVALSAYLMCCRAFPLPMHRYMTGVLGRLTWRQRVLTIFDQLNPAYAKYYLEVEVRNLLESTGFTEVSLYHRHRYSWTAIGVRPSEPT
jgi:SAM-dependent methyltransferase